MAAVIESYSLSGSDKALTYAISALARSGATRSNYHANYAYLYAQANIARSAATRSNYHAPTVFISIGGVQYGEGRANPHTRVLLDSLTITDVLNEDPNTLSMRTKGFVPSVGAEVIVTLGSPNNLRREFGGRVAQTRHTYWDNPQQDEYGVSAIDYTWGLNTRKVSAYYSGGSASTIAAALIAGWAPGYTAAYVQAGLPNITGGITFTHADLTDCLSQLAKRIGASWYIDYRKALHFFLTDTTATDPQPLTLAHATARELAIRRDASQWITRAIVEGGGVNALAPVAPGATQIPVDDIVWYPAGGGLVSAGAQHIQYGGVFVGGGGALIGPGAAPTGALVAALAPAAGSVPPGLHHYSFTFVTALGESLAAPITAITVGTVPPPTSAPTVGAPAIGPGPDPGAHDYAVSFLTASGETLPGPRVSASTGYAGPPASPPTPTVQSGGGIPAGSHTYAVTFVTSQGGETMIGPVSSAVSTSTVPNAPAPIFIANGPSATVGDLTVGHTYAYGICWSTASGQTVHSEQTGLISTIQVPALATTATLPNGATPGMAGNGPNETQGDLTPGHVYRYGICWSTAAGQTVHTEQTALVNTVPVQALASTTNAAKSSHILIDVPYGPDGAKWVHLYRVDQTATPASNVGDYRLLASFANVINGGTTRFTDTLANTAIAGNPAPTNTNTSFAGHSSHIAIAVPYGPAGVQWCHLYRVDQTAVPGSNVSDYRRLASFANGTYGGTTRFTDTLPNTAIAGNPAPTQTNTAKALAAIQLTSLPKSVGTGVAARKVYRTDGGSFGLIATINDNTTTSYLDTAGGIGAAPPAASTAYAQQFPLSAIPLGGLLVTGRKLYRTAANASGLKLLATLADNTTTSYLDTLADASLGAAPPATSTATATSVQLSSIPVGQVSVTARKLYRSATGGGTLKLLATLADNVTTSYLDLLADGSLGAAVPTQDTSGLKQPEGSVNAGATTIPVSGAAWALPGGGWVVIGNGQQVIRYTAVSGNTLTGIPSSGDGSITATISYNSSITAAPLLTGIPTSGTGAAIIYPILKGDEVNVLAIVTDPTSANALAALIGGDGIQEEFLQDRRLSYAETLARGDALLKLRGALDLSVHYTCRDLNTASGRQLAVYLTAPYNLQTTLKIQRAVITYALARHYPLYTVEASSQLFAFEDLLRMARLTRGT